MNTPNAASPDNRLSGRRGFGSRFPPRVILVGAFHLAAGLILGAFVSRLLAEWPGRVLGRLPLAWPFPGATLALTLGAGIVFVVVYVVRAAHRERTRDVRPGQASVGVALSSLIPFFLLGLYLVQPAPNLLQAGVLFGGALALSLLLSGLPGMEAEWPIWLLLFLVSLIAYLNTLMPAVGTRDGYELQAVSATLGFAHPTGYPLFPILGRVWIALFAFGPIAWRINVLCAIYAAASVPLVYGTARRVLGRPTQDTAREHAHPRPRPPGRRSLDGRAAAAWSALLFAFSHTLWTQASQPEKYTLNALFVALVLYVAFGTDTRPPTAEPGQTDYRPRGPHPHLRWLAFTYGLSLTHHRTMLMLAPALALYLVGRGVRRRDPGLLKRLKEWLPALGITLAPLLIYLYIPWRAYAQGWTMTLSEFLRYISGAYYGPAVRLMDWANPERSLMFWRFLVTQFGYLGIALGVLGLVGLALRRQWRFLACTALAYATYYFWGTVWYAYYNDVNSFIPNHMILSIWIGSGAMTAWGAIETLMARISNLGASRQADRVSAAVFWSLAALMPLFMIWTNGPLVNQSDEWEMTQWGERAIAADLVHPLGIAPNATILADREKYPPLDYFARIERRRPDTDVVILGDEQAYLERLTRDLAQDKADGTSPVYLARFLPGLEGPYHLISIGPLVKVSAAPLTEVGKLEGTPAVLTTTDGTDVELLGYSIQREKAGRQDRQSETLTAGDSLRLTLFWRTPTPVPGNDHVALRLVGVSGQQWWASSEHPVSGMYPTAAWKPGEIVADWHEVPIGRALPPGTYTLEVGLFPPFSQEGLPSEDKQMGFIRGMGFIREGPWTPLTTLTVTPAPSPPTPLHRLRAVAPGRLELLGFDLPGQAAPTGRAVLTLYWRPLAPLPNYQIGTRVIATAPDSQGASPEQDWTWAVPGKGEYPTSSWALETIVLTEHPLTMPATEGQAVVQIAIRGDEPVSLYPRWLAPKTQILSLPPIQIAGRPPAAPGATNFDDRILLLDNDLGKRTLAPGSPLELGLRWQGMQPMDANYTLFIHILAPDGTLKGQIDVWPKDGTYPTSQWRAGEVFEDRYLLYIDPDAPPGTCQVEIGWYLLETMRRLPVLDAQGRAIDDKVLLAGLTVQ